MLLILDATILRLFPPLRFAWAFRGEQAQVPISGRNAKRVLLDRAPCHEAGKSQQLAARLGIVLLWLPKQCSEVNAVDHRWRERKRLIAANRQFRTVDEEADYAEHWFLGLSPRAALRKAGLLSEDCWLKDFLENFWLPT